MVFKRFDSYLFQILKQSIQFFCPNFCFSDAQQLYKTGKFVFPSAERRDSNETWRQAQWLPHYSSVAQ